jgi:hypothetical protein
LPACIVSRFLKDFGDKGPHGSSIMLNLWRVVLLALLLVHYALAGTKINIVEADVSSTGEASTSSMEGIEDIEGSEQAATFVNNYKDKVLYVYWEGEDGSVVKMSKLKEGGSATFHSYVGHSFFATFEQDSAGERATPGLVRSAFEKELMFYMMLLTLLLALYLCTLVHFLLLFSSRFGSVREN